MAHVAASVYQVVHQVFIDAFANDWVVSVHGMVADGVSLSNGAGGATSVTSAVGHVYGAFVAAYPESYITSCNAWEGAVVAEVLCGTTNTQGRYVNASQEVCNEPAAVDSGRFVHMEQSKVFRDDPVGVATVLQAAWDAP